MDSSDRLYIIAVEAEPLKLIGEAEFITHPINEEHPIEVIHFMQDAAGH